MKIISTIFAVALFSAQAGYCSGSVLGSLKTLANAESVSVVPAGEPKSVFGLFSGSTADSGIVRDGAILPYFLMAPQPAYTAQEAGVNSGYPMLRSHAVLPDKAALLKAVGFWSAFLEKAGVKLYSLDASGAGSGYTLEVLYIGEPVIKSFDSASAGLVYASAGAAAKSAGEIASGIEKAGGKVFEKFIVSQGGKFSFAVYFKSGAPAAENISKAVDLFEVEAGIGAIVQGVHQVGAYISGAASHAANTESYKVDYKGRYKSAAKAVEVLIEAAEDRSNVKSLEIYSNDGAEGRLYSCLVFWKGRGF